MPEVFPKPRMTKRRQIGEAAYFWSKVDIRGPDDCWPWQAARFGPMQYGMFSRQRPDGSWYTELAHRTAYQLTNGKIPDGLNVCHSCDNGPCCNPAHFFPGTQADNIKDMHVKGRDRGRGTCGENQGSAKLTEANIREIRCRHRPNDNALALAKEFCVDRSQINRIARGAAWKHVSA